jgi:hypothetical protein
MKSRIFVIGSVAVCLFQASNTMWAQFPPAGTDSTPSLGQFTIVLNPSFSGAMAANPSLFPGYTPSTNRYVSPLLYDPTTLINRSNPTTVGSSAYTNGTTLFGSGLTTSNGSISVFPTGYTPPPPGQDMVFTQIGAFNLVGGNISVTAGTSAVAGIPPSLGEVISNSGSGGGAANDFPAKSFFDVFVDITLPVPAALGGGTVELTNATVYSGTTALSPPGTALVVSNSGIMSFPPTVIYTHGGSSAVPLFVGPGGFNNSGIDAGDVIGLLTLAGHGAGYSPGGSSTGGTGSMSTTNSSAFEMAYSQMTELPVPQGGDGQTPQIVVTSTGMPMTNTTPDAPYGGWGTAADPVQVEPEPSTISLLAVFGVGAGATWHRRRKAVLRKRLESGSLGTAHDYTGSSIRRLRCGPARPGHRPGP